jgi:hypothetical protein
MTNTEEKTRHERWREIERKHLGRCLDQVWGEGRRALIERIELIDHRSTVIVIKLFEKSVPKSSAREWPELSGVWVYVPLPENDRTWEETDRELAAHRAKLDESHGA